MSAPLVYLDNNATTRPAPEVVEAMAPFFSELWGNPSSMHAFGGQVAKPVAEARERVAAFVNAERPEEIDANRARRAADQAKEALLQKRSIQEYRVAQYNLARAMSRLRVHSDFTRK